MPLINSKFRILAANLAVILLLMICSTSNGVGATSVQPNAVASAKHPLFNKLGRDEHQMILNTVS
jgi:hypothetical protein